jgi:hypothetical protein
LTPSWTWWWKKTITTKKAQKKRPKGGDNDDEENGQTRMYSRAILETRLCPLVLQFAARNAPMILKDWW